MAQLTKAVEDYINTFPVGQLFRITDIAQRYWCDDMLAWSFDATIATHFRGEDMADIMERSCRYTNLDPHKQIFLEAAPAGLKKSLLLSGSRH